MNLIQLLKKLFCGDDKMPKVRKNKEGKYSDRENLSKEKHELQYVKKMAKEQLDALEKKESHKNVLIRVSKLRRLCDYVLQE